MKKILIVLFALMIPLFYSCEEADEIIENLGLTDLEINAGLKEALAIATDTAVSIVSKVDGYYKDEIIKILLPPEADIIVDNLNNPLLQGLGFDQLIGRDLKDKPCCRRWCNRSGTDLLGCDHRYYYHRWV